MKFCASCNKDFPDAVRFCCDCGTKLSEKPEAQPAPATGINIQDAVVVGGVHTTDSRTFISHQDDTREVLTCAGCGANVRKPNGFTCPQCGRFYCADDYHKDKKACRGCAESKADAAVRMYRTLLDDVMRDGRIDADERAKLDQARLDLRLSAELCAELEKERRSAAVPASGRLGRRDQALLDEARQLLFDTLSFEEALRVVQPLFERIADNPDIRRVYLLALIETDSERAVDVINAMRFDDLDKSMAQIEALARLGKYDLAYQALEDARRAFGVDNPELVASEADLALEEYRRTGRKALLDVSVECVGRLPEKSTEYSSYAKAFLRHMKGDKQPLAELAQAGNYYAKRKKHFILNQAKPRRSATVAAAPPTAPKPEPPPAIERPAEVPQPPPPTSPHFEVPPPPPMPALMPGVWRLTLMTAWGQTFYGTCQVNAAGSNVMMIAEVSGQALLWDGLVHFFAERSIFRGGVMGVNVAATCSELMRMVDGMVVPVPGLPIRLNAVVGDNGHSINGTVVNSLGETARILLSI